MELAFYPDSGFARALETKILENKVLVVEDDPFWQEMIRLTIERTALNCRVSFATSGEEAMTKLQGNGQYQLIVADEYLEGNKTGHELWRDCQERGIHTPFLLTSGNADLQELEDLQVRFMPKPFAISELRSVIREMLAPSPRLNLTAGLTWLYEASHKVGEGALFLTIVVAIMAIDFSLNKAMNIEAPQVIPEERMAPPPVIKEYLRETQVAMAPRKIFNPQLEAQLERIYRRADEIKFAAGGVLFPSQLRILKNTSVERRELGVVQ